MKEKVDSQENDIKYTAAIVNSDMDIAYDESSINLTSDTSDCMINSGASFYVTVHRNYFTS